LESIAQPYSDHLVHNFEKNISGRACSKGYRKRAFQAAMIGAEFTRRFFICDGESDDHISGFMMNPSVSVNG
jgi:hypothetical protein